MARWLRFANTLGALELLAADVCAAAAARPHCLAPDDLARQFILLSRALHLFVDRARSPASLWRGPLPPTAARRAARRVPRSGSFAPRRQRARILAGARRFVLTVARRSRLEALPPSAQTAAAAVAPRASAAGRTS